MFLAILSVAASQESSDLGMTWVVCLSMFSFVLRLLRMEPRAKSSGVRRSANFWNAYFWFDLGSTRVIQRRFNVSVPRARVPEKASALRDRSEG